MSKLPSHLLSDLLLPSECTYLRILVLSTEQPHHLMYKSQTRIHQDSKVMMLWQALINNEQCDEMTSRCAIHTKMHVCTPYGAYFEAMRFAL